MTDPIHLETRDQTGARLFSPSAGRNKAVIGEQLSSRLGKNARVLEIAGGTGEHAAHICGIRPDIVWQPSDPDAGSRASQNAWAADYPERILPSVHIDTTATGWQDPFAGIYCANMIHIAPWGAAIGMADGAKDILEEGGQFFLYGPFKEGAETAPSNLQFDESLKSRNLAWGVRDLQSVKHIFADAGFNMTARIVMPKDNRLLVFSK